jgi:hypothetical protein
MAHNMTGPRLPMKAASGIAQYVPVTPVPAGSSLSETVYRAGSVNDYPLGFTIATGASPGDELSVQYGGVVKGIAGGSLGAGALLGVGCVNGILIPLTPSGAASVANYPVRWSVGISLKNAAAGDEIPVLVKADQII